MLQLPVNQENSHPYSKPSDCSQERARRVSTSFPTAFVLQAFGSSS